MMGRSGSKMEENEKENVQNRFIQVASVDCCVVWNYQCESRGMSLLAES